MSAGNQHSYFCPHCGSDEGIRIKATVEVKLVHDGVITDESNVEWGDDSPCHCHECGWNCEVSDLIVKE